MLVYKVIDPDHRNMSATVIHDPSDSLGEYLVTVYVDGRVVNACNTKYQDDAEALADCILDAYVSQSEN